MFGSVTTSLIIVDHRRGMKQGKNEMRKSCSVTVVKGGRIKGKKEKWGGGGEAERNQSVAIFYPRVFPRSISRVLMHKTFRPCDTASSRRFVWGHGNRETSFSRENNVSLPSPSFGTDETFLETARTIFPSFLVRKVVVHGMWEFSKRSRIISHLGETVISYHW